MLKSLKPVRQFRGMTIVEVLVSVAIFSIVILMLFGTFNFALKVTRYSHDTTVATNIASDKLEALRQAGFDGAGTIGTVTAPTMVAQLPDGFMTVAVEGYQNNAKVKKVTVSVYWRNRPESRAVTLTTLIGQGGIGG